MKCFLPRILVYYFGHKSNLNILIIKSYMIMYRNKFVRTFKTNYLAESDRSNFLRRSFLSSVSENRGFFPITYAAAYHMCAYAKSVLGISA